MEGRFKCCSKDFNYKYCIECAGLFHVSCAARLKRIKEFDGYKIICSQICQKTYDDKTHQLDKLQAESLELDRILHEKEVNIEQSVNDWENEKKDLRIVIENLEKDIIDREVHLNKLKKMMREFEDAAMENETTHIEEIKKQKDVISQLCDEMSHLQHINDELKSKIETYEKDMQHLNKNMVDITDINRNMVTTIEVLEQENRMFAAQLKIHKQPCKENHSYDLETIDLTVPSSEGRKRVDNGFTIERLDGVYGRSSPSHSVVEEWATRFCMSQEFLEDDRRPGRPVEVITEGKVVLVEELVLSDRGLKVRIHRPKIWYLEQYPYKSPGGDV
nr:unnamed protein product [Callosobruchus analis]